MRATWQRILSMQKYKFPTKVELLTFSWDSTVHQTEKSMNS